MALPSAGSGLPRLSRGQAQPYASVPRIDWSHPLADALAFYVYVSNSVAIDLVNGLQGHKSTSNPPLTGIYVKGRGFTYGGTGWTWWDPTNTYNTFCGTTPFACVMATYPTNAAPATARALAALVPPDTSGSNASASFFTDGTTTGQVTVAFNNGASSQTFSQSQVANTFQTWATNATSATAADLYGNGKFDRTASGITTTGSLAGLSLTGGPCLNNGSSSAGNSVTANGIIGFVAYYAGWNRNLTAAEMLQLHLDPYALLIYPEEDYQLVGVIPTTLTWGFEQVWQPPSRNNQSNRAAALMRGHEGIEAPLIRWQNTGSEIQPFQPPHPRPEKAGTLFGGDQGNEFTEIRWFNTGWEIQPPQPPHPRPEKGGILFGGDSGIEFTEIRWFNTGWEIQPPQPPHQRIEERFAAIIQKDEGNELSLINWFNTGWEIQPPQPPHPRPEKSGAIMPSAPGIDAKFVPTVVVPSGWEIQPPQPPHPRPERFGAIEPKDDGIQYPLINWFNTGWEIQPVQPPHQRIEERFAAIVQKDEGSEFTFVNWYNSGWEIAPVQPPHPRPERSGAIAPISNIEAVFVAQAVTVVPAGWEIPFVTLKTQPTISQKVIGAKGRSDFALFVNWQNAGWEIQPPQPPHSRPEKAGSIMFGDSGIEAAFVPPVVTVVPAGWEVQPFQPPHPRPERAGAIFGPINIEATFTPFFALGWEIQSVQPPHLRLEERFAAIVQRDDGNESPFISWKNTGWEIAPYQPRAYRASTGGIMPSDQGTEFTQVVWFNYGWEIPSPQPPHPRPERSGAISPKDEGIGLPFVPPPTVAPAGWEVLPIQPPHPRPERSGAIARSDDGTEFTFTNWLNFNWQIQPVQPPHPRPEIRSGAFVRFDEGIETILINWLVDGWQVQPVQPPHPRPEKAGAIMVGDTGTEAPFVFVPLPVTWFPDINNFIPVRPRRFGAGALPTIFENFPFFPPVTPPIPPIPPGFVAEKVISVNVAPLLPIFPSVLFGDPILPSIVNVGDPFALLVSPAQTLTPNTTYTLLVTKPDGTTYQASSPPAPFQNNSFQNNAFQGIIPQVYLANVDSHVRQGLFPAQSYVALIIPGSFVDQHGYWSVALQSGSFTSQPQKFYIGPPTVLT